MEAAVYILGVLAASLLAVATFTQRLEGHRDLAIFFLGLSFAVAIMGATCWTINHLRRADGVAIVNARNDLTILPPVAPVPTPIPANRPADMPAIPDDAVFFYLGSAYVWSRSLPHVVFRDRGKPVLTIDRDDSGRIKVSGVFYSADGTLLGQLVNNQFFPNHRNAQLWRVATSEDASGIELLDNDADVILSVKSLNKKTVKVLGKYHLRNGFRVFVDEAEQRIGPMVFSGGAELPNVGGTFEIR